MRANGLGARRRKRFRKTTDSNHPLPCAKNLVQREFTVADPNQVWASDGTFIWTNERWLYLSVALDFYSRKVVGWGMGTENDMELVQGSPAGLGAPVWATEGGQPAALCGISAGDAGRPGHAPARPS